MAEIKQLTNTNYYNLTVPQVIDNFDSSPDQGLNQEEADRKLEQYGSNSLSLKKIKTPFQMVLDQLKNPLILILLFVIAIKTVNLLADSINKSLSVQSLIEIIMVAVVVLISIWVGVSQELSAEKSLEKLRSQVKFFTRVLRSGKLEEIDANQIVYGDILILESGDRVPADCRVIESINGQVNESLLTGESEEVAKTSDKMDSLKPIPAEQKNMIFAGTSMVGGKIKAVVCKIGRETEFGKISQELENSKPEDTKFQKQVKSLLTNLTILSGAAFILLEILYIFVLKLDTLRSVETGLALVISFIPEALSAVTVIVLSISAANLVKKGIIVKNLASAEGMGSVNIFLTDKTGTITQGKMSIEELWFLDGPVKSMDFKAHGTRESKILEILRFCNNSKGATEEALTNFVKLHGFEPEFFNRKAEYNYNSTTKRMTVVRENNGQHSAYVKGAGEVLLEMCHFYYDHKSNAEISLNKEISKQILNQIEDYASKGLRVLLLAYRDYHPDHEFGNREKDEAKLVFTGLICLLDPLRDEVFETVEKFNSAGIDLVMITGDHPNIAGYLAQKAGIIKEQGNVITGAELENYITYEIKDLPKDVVTKLINTHVFARVTPKHKEFLVELFKANGKIVAMAGDGVNDAVAIKKANIGIAVKNAVDWVRDIAGIVVTGGFDALIQAIEEGRKIIYRARLFSHYLLSGNISQVGIFVLISLTSGNPPLTSLQLLVINLLTDTLPALALAYEKVPVTIMEEKPESSKTNLINKSIWTSIIIQGSLASLFLFLVFETFENKGLVYAQTTVFLAYLCQKLYRAFTARSFTQSIFEIGLFSNKMTVYSVFGSIFVAFMLIGPLSNFVGMSRVSLEDFRFIALSAFSIPVFEEIFKFVRKQVAKSR